LTYLLILLRLLPLISQLNSLRSGFANTAASVDIVAEFLSRQNKPFMGTGKVLYKKLEREIEFRNISFAYPGSDKLVLKNVSLSLPRGTTLALVGSSGAGKSTMAYLLPRFYDPTSGDISLDGVNLRDLDLNSLRKVMGIVSQDTFLFNDSVRNNIAYGRIEATDEEILMAAKRANAYEFISKLAQGFDTQIGDRGVMLSGGQRQRLAIARALLQNPDILVLDEATSALDSVSERLVQAALDELSRDRTTLVIAHRLSTIQNADQIAVLDQGSVVEVGKHEELLAKGGYYSRLYSIQFSPQPETKKKRLSSLLNISHEIRTQLNSMIGLLRLLLDELIDNAQERQEVVEESYRSTWRVLSSLDILDDIFDLQTKHKGLLDQQDPAKQADQQDQNLRHISDEFRTGIYPLLSSLRLLSNNING
jgi:subfamily B ATP-binding cassette protein MsbA